MNEDSSTASAVQEHGALTVPSDASSAQATVISQREIRDEITRLLSALDRSGYSINELCDQVGLAEEELLVALQRLKVGGGLAKDAPVGFFWAAIQSAGRGLLRPQR